MYEEKERCVCCDANGNSGGKRAVWAVKPTAAAGEVSCVGCETNGCSGDL